MRQRLRQILKKYIVQLGSKRDGAVMPAFAAMVTLIFVCMCAAVDLSRTVQAREKLGQALDGAVLEVASMLSTSVMSNREIEDKLKEAVTVNLAKESFLREALDSLDFSLDADNGTLTVTSDAHFDQYLIDIGGNILPLLGKKVFKFGSRAQVTFSRFDVELALVLDVTGSMDGDMGTLKEASKGLVNILVQDASAQFDSKVRISVVPYSQGVNLGDYAEKVKGGAYGYADRSNCVTTRQDYDDGDDVYEVEFSDAPFDYYDAQNPPPAGTFYGGGSSSCASDSEMIPLTANKDKLIRAIEDLEARGGTAGQTGITWGWNSLSPNYDDVWPGESRPAAYEDEEVLKFAIVMTDGDNNRHYEFTETEIRSERVCWRDSRGRNRCRYEDVEYLVNRWDERDENEDYNNNSSRQSRALCSAMKARGIEVFGVYFGNNSNSSGSRNMQACASDGNYYQARNASALIASFKNIAKKIQQIYLSK